MAGISAFKRRSQGNRLHLPEDAQRTGGDYPYKYDLLRNLVLELIYSRQKLQPISALRAGQNASERITSLLLELLERQFPLDSLHQRLRLRTPKDYTDQLAVYVNHLNRVLKEVTGTTTALISRRVVQEAKVVLKQTNRNIAEIGYTFGFDDLAHFSNCVKKQASFIPVAFRS